MPECKLCVLPDPDDVVTAWVFWKLVVNHNQNYLGKVMLVLKRHATDVNELTGEEQIEFWSALRETRMALEGALQPDHLNYAFLMNQDAHVHLHIVPRYASAREFRGEIFSDGQLGEHYALTARIVSPEMRHTLARLLQAKGLNS